MKELEIRTQQDLNDVVHDTSCKGLFIQFYEMLQESLSQYGEDRIKSMKDTLKFVYEDDGELYKSDKEVDSLSKLETIYLYSLLP